MAARSRNKGKRGERAVVNAFLAAGIPCRRDWESQSKPGGQADGDLSIGEDTPLEGTIYAEVRYRERMSVWACLREIAAKAKGRRRILIFRRNREGWHVALPLDEYLELLKRSQDG